MAKSVGKEGRCSSIMARLGLKPFTQHNISTFYAPITGVSCYTALAVNVSSPDLFQRLSPNRDVTIHLLVGSVVGNAVYLYNRKHMRVVPPKFQVFFSLYGATFFNLGSVLLWAIISNLVPDNVLIKSTAGIVSGGIFIHLIKYFLDSLDANVKEESK